MTRPKILLISSIIVVWVFTGWGKGRVRDFCATNGVSLFHLYEDPQKWVIARDRLHSADWLGLNWHRFDFWWGIIEPKKNQVDFTFCDKVVETVLNKRRRLMPILCYNSAWQPNISPATPEEQELYARFVYNVVNRYKDKIKDWEIWNEPNITPFWVPKPNPEHYAELLKRAYREAKKADKDSNIVGFCTAGPDYSFIETVYELGAGKACDTLSYHHYNDIKDEAVLEKEIYEIKGIMNRYGDEKKKIWITEIGLPTGENAEVIKPFTDGDQAIWLIKKMLTALGTRQVERLFWFTINDWTTDPKADGHWGVFDFYLLPKPSAFAYRTFLRLVGEKEYIGSIMLTPTAKCFLFSNDDNDMMGILWTKNLKEKVQLYAEQGELKIYSLYGEREARKIKEEFLEIELTPLPIYVEGLDKGYALLASVKSEEAPVFVVPGEEKEITIKVKNPLRRQQRFEITGELKGGKLMIKDSVRKIRRKDTEKIKAVVSINRETNPGWREILIRLQGRRSTYLDECYTVIPIKVIEPIKAELKLSAEAEVIKLKSSIKNVSQTKLAGKVFWRLEPQGEVKRQPEEIKDLMPNQSQEFGAYLRPGFGEGTIRLITQIEVSGEREFSAKKRLAVMPFLEKTNFVIDAKLNDWQDSLSLSLNSREQLIVEKAPTKWQSEDLSGIVKLCGDKENLFIAIDIVDDKPLINPYQGENIWRGDGVEIYIGFLGPSTQHWYGDKDFQLVITPGGEGIEPYCWLFQSGKQPQKLSAAKIAVQKAEKGYALEVQLPLSAFGVKEIKPPSLLGFDIALNDLDEAGGKEEKDLMLMWNGTDSNWRDPTDWGALQILRQTK